MIDRPHFKPYIGRYQPNSPAPYRVSRSKIEDFYKCPLCFVLDRKFGVSKPKLPSWPLNSAVDALLKKEFDEHRAAQTIHPALVELNCNLVPFQHSNIDEWRSNFKGITYFDSANNLELFGAVDDVWQSENGELVVVDYKATAKPEPVEELSDEPWHMSYRRQIDFYQWLLVKNGFAVAKSGFWLYATARNNGSAFNKQLNFDLRLIEHPGDYSWVEPTINAAKAALDSDELPLPSPDCEHCKYVTARAALIDFQ